MKYLFFSLAFLVSQTSFAQNVPTVLEPLKPLATDAVGVASPTPAPTDPTQQPGQNPGNPGQTPGQTPGQNPGPVQHPHPPGKGGKHGGGSGEYDGGAPEYEQIYYTPAYISKMIAENMSIQCYRGLCEMAMVDTRGEAFVAEVSAGYGVQNGMNGMGGSGGGTGGGLVVVSSGAYATTPQPYAGVTLRYVAQHCKQSVRVPVSLYVSMNTYLYNLINEDGTTKRTFDPAEQTMILFYTTVMKQANGCTTPTR